MYKRQVTSIVVLTKFSRCSYTVGAILYALGFIVDVCSVAILITFLAIINDRAEYNDHGGVSLIWSLLVIVPIALGAVSFLVGAVFAFKTVCNWERNGAINVLRV